MSGTRRTHCGITTLSWGFQPAAWIQNELPTWPARKAPRELLTQQQCHRVGLTTSGVAPAGQLMTRHKGRDVRVPLWDRTELAPAELATEPELQFVARTLNLPVPATAPGQDQGAHRGRAA